MSGYYQAPNVSIPLNNRPRGEIAGIAWEQLKPYQDAAAEWPVFRDGLFNRCSLCTQNLWYACDVNGNVYVYGEGETIALTVAHIRQVHSEVITNEGTAECHSILDSPGDVHSGNVSNRDADRPRD